MPRRRKLNAKQTTVTTSTSNSRTRRNTTRAASSISRKAHKQVSKDTKSIPSSRPTRGTRSGLRSQSSTELKTIPILADPQVLIRKANREKKESKAAAAAAAAASKTVTTNSRSVASAKVRKTPENYPSQVQSTRDHAQSIEVALAGLSRRVDRTNTASEASGGVELSVSQDPEQEFNRSWGYLPPLDDEATAIIEAIIANPAMATEYMRINPSNREFSRGLEYRNVSLSESNQPDCYADKIPHLKTPDVCQEETDAETDSHERLWAWDQAKINKGSNEALFQRTMMMDMIGRHIFIYPTQRTKLHGIDFSVEEPWTCHPMPTRAYDQRASFLSQPKPDLAVFFQRQSTIPDKTWNTLPNATQRLACYETIDEPGLYRVFHFLTVEAKKNKISTEDTVGKRQSLNNASQSLHNLFEFFREAGHEQTFYEEVRFFSVVASTEGLWIRIHQACKEPENGTVGLIMPKRKDYPLRFEYRDFAQISKAEFTREKVLKIFENILLGYGVGVLRELIYKAALSIETKLHSHPQAYMERGNSDFYRYGQTIVNPKSRLVTPMQSRPGSVRERSVMSAATGPVETSHQDFSQSTMAMSDARSQVATETPIPSQAPVFEAPEPERIASGKGRKRQKSPSPSKPSSSTQRGSKRRAGESFSSAMSI